jgi:long-chain acyl-CoA synthetase
LSRQSILYDKWREVARAEPERVALRELVTDRAWTFARLAAEAECPPALPEGPVFSEGNHAGFILQVLRGWRCGRVICPIEEGQHRPNPGDALPAETVHLKTTSATTGVPRCVAFTAAQLAADTRNIVETKGLRAEWPNIGVISLAHSYGFSNLVLPLLLHGVPLVLAGAPLPEAVRRAAALESGVTLASVPALWQMWCEAKAIPNNVRLAISAGAVLPLALEQTVFERFGLKIHNFYGSTECGGIAYDASNVPRTDVACVGTALRNVSLSVAEDGCVEVRSAAVGQTYWPDGDPNLGGGVFHTSDLGEIRDGQVFLRGRAGDQINVAGRKVAPELIERALSMHPQVKNCVAFGIANGDVQRGETIVACVATAPGTTVETLKQFALTRLAPWQVPREWWLVDSLEANQRGKISRAEWRLKYARRKADG